MLEIVYKIFDFIVIVLLGYCIGLFASLLYSPDIVIEYIALLFSILIGLVVLLGILSSIGVFLMKKRF
jgi:hypothetical protein